MPLQYIKLHVTRQEPDASGRRKIVRVNVAETDMSDVNDGKGTRNVPLLLMHALSIGGENVAERIGFDYLFDKPLEGNSNVCGFILGEENGFPYVFGEQKGDDWGFEMTD